MIELNNIYNEDCLDGMKRIPNGAWIASFAICRMELLQTNGMQLYHLSRYGNNTIVYAKLMRLLSCLQDSHSHLP